jgi:hypothetical protein
MYYSYIEIEYLATSFSPPRRDLALKLLREGKMVMAGNGFSSRPIFVSYTPCRQAVGLSRTPYEAKAGAH